MDISYLYIITYGQAFKVGISKDPNKRLKSLQTSNPNKLQLLEVFGLPKNYIFRIEKECHIALQSRFVKRGEWFHGASQFHIRLLVEEVCERYLK